MTTSSYDTLLTKLDQFTRKYYLNKVIRGALYATGLILGLFLLFSLLEYYFYFPTTVRKVFFYGFIGVSIASLAYWVVKPLVSYIGLGSRISHNQAAEIIGNHFTDVKDKLLNVLQLKEQSSSVGGDLLLASIEQKTSEIKLVPFQKAIDLSLNRKYLKYALPPFLLLLFVLFAAPSLIKDSTTRIINNDKEYEKASPFSLSIDVSSKQIVQGEDLQLTVKPEGDALPADVYLAMDDFQYKMKNQGKGVFEYTLRNLQKDLSIRAKAGRVTSAAVSIDVIEKPSIASIQVELRYPSYTGLKKESLTNIGDFTIPEGTDVRWFVDGANVDRLDFVFNESKPVAAEKKGASSFYQRRRIRTNTSYKMLLQNNALPIPDSILYSVTVLKDQHPNIGVEEFIDSVSTTTRYYVGSASDDYGIASLQLHYSITDSRGMNRATEIVPLKVGGKLKSNYKYLLDLSKYDLKPGEKMSYFFQVKDNDAVNGGKTARTDEKTFAKASLKEMKDQEQDNEEDIKNTLKESVENLKEIQERYEKLRKDLLQKNEFEWKDKQALEQLLEKQKEIQEKLKEAKEKNDENLKNQQELEKPNEEIEKKQEKLDELFEEALDPEKEDLLEKIEDLMQELDKDNSLEMMEQMESQSEEQEMDMKRLLELYKQLEVEKEANELMDKLEELAEKQEELSKETEEGKKSSEELEKKQEELNKEMDDLQKKMEELQKKNEELERPKDLGEENEEKMEDIKEDMEKSEEELGKKNKSKAAKKQQKAASKMKQMAQKMQESMEGDAQESQGEDIKLLRQLLENLVYISYEQEELVAQVGETKSVEPRYVDLIQNQNKIKDDFASVEDSLVALANRNEKIESIVLDKISEINTNMKKGIGHLTDRATAKAMNNQRRSMTNINDLALMLSESLKNMQQSMSSMPGAGSCSKPGGKGKKPGGVPKDKISEGSKAQGEKLQEMLNGKKQGQGKGGGQGNTAKDFAEAAARQAALRKALEKMQQDAREQGQGTKELDELIEEMNKIEIDLVNKRLDSKLIARQQEITTRLLQAEKAERQREYDNKRKSKSAEDIKNAFPPSLEEYIKKREAEIEQYRTSPLKMRPYYKSMVNKYYQNLNGN